ncbi:LysR family transcriptional regulator [Pigmentiphaga aceris]|uniref:LysR family transcriptional regulator n=2 Tax=Pigmentiphaga aceris TaxID=1940612 RepID=A0A5C0B4C6_9BURK|nr:LysR family transcriptional regulator [Pigmentiphaga aceris]
MSSAAARAPAARPVAGKSVVAAVSGRGGPLNLRQIEVFRAIMISGSLSEAGRLLFVSQPAISRALAACENRLGFPLFDRVKGRLHATPEAKRLFEEVVQVYDGIRRVNDLAQNLADDRSGVLHVVSSPSFGEYLVPRVITRFRIKHANVQIKYRPLTMDVLVPQLLLGHADVGISMLPPQHPSLETREIGAGNMMCIVPRFSPLAELRSVRPQDLLGQTLIGYGADTPLGMTVSGFFETIPQALPPAIEVRSALTACAMVREGAGVALIDSYCVTPGLLRDVVVRPIAPSIELKIHVTHSRLEPLSVLANAFMTTFRAVVRETLPSVLPKRG